MEAGETPQSTKLATKLETARKIAIEKGGERRRETAKRISNFFSNIKEKITTGVDFTLGLPDAATYLGTEAAKYGEKKVTEARDSVVEAGTRAWESIIDTKDRLVQRGINAGNRLVARYEQTRDTIKAKVADLSKRAAVWGLIKIAVPIENRLQQICEIPANIKEWQGRREGIRAERHERKAKFVEKSAKERAQALLAEISRIEHETSVEIGRMNALRDTALARAEQANKEAETIRERVRKRFGKARAAVASLQTR